MSKATVEFYIMISSEGEFVVHRDADELAMTWDCEIGETPSMTRVMAVSLNVPLPQMATATGDVPDKGDEPVNLTIS